MAQEYIGQTCPYCQFIVREGPEAVQCPKCRVPHHQKCWEQNGACTTIGCNVNNFQALFANRLVVTLDEPGYNHPNLTGTGRINKLHVGAIILAFLIITLLVGSIVMFDEKESLGMTNVQGNTAGNLINGGIAALQGDWIYYRSNDNEKIYKVKTDGSGQSKVNDDRSLYINVIGNWIYYVNSDDDNRIYKIRTDGSGREKVNDEESWFLKVVGDWIYYYSEGVYKIRTDGTERTHLISERAGSLNVFGDWIYFVNIDREICRIRTDGSGFEIIENAHRASRLNVVDEWIYHIWSYDAGSYIYRVRNDGSGYEQVTGNEAIDLNIDGNWIYYTNLEDDLKIYKLQIEGDKHRKVNEDNSWNINLVDDWIFYENRNDEGRIYKIRTDGSERQRVD